MAKQRLPAGDREQRMQKATVADVDFWRFYEAFADIAVPGLQSSNE